MTKLKFIAEDFPSLDDIDILKRAFEEKRIVLTNDKDFGALIFKEKLGSRGLGALYFVFS